MSIPTLKSIYQELPCKPVALNARKAGGAFQPFMKEKLVELPATSTTAGDSGDKPASVDTDKRSSGDKETTTNKDGKGKDTKEVQSSSSRKPRRCWAPELHRRFLQALQQLGGSHGWYHPTPPDRAD
jgi:hypothetical protein